jgi:hypothetical protein
LAAVEAEEEQRKADQVKRDKLYKEFQAWRDDFTKRAQRLDGLVDVLIKDIKSDSSTAISRTSAENAYEELRKRWNDNPERFPVAWGADDVRSTVQKSLKNASLFLACWTKEQLLAALEIRAEELDAEIKDLERE